MKGRLTTTTARRACAAVVLMLANQEVGAQETPITREQFLLLQQQNQQMQQQLQKQQELIDSLNRKVSEIQDANARREEAAGAKTGSGDESSASYNKSFRLGKVSLSGEGGVAFFHSQSDGPTPNAEFRIDEAKLFVEAPIWDEVYFFSEINLATREYTDLTLRVGELYLDFENVSRLWGRDRMLNLRVGRMNIPFGEEYQYRYTIDNPLISHSLSDLWGVDEGIELYGALGRFQYAAAIQNGGVPAARDFTSDKSIAGRLGYDPAQWLHLSVSGMRTGGLDPAGDMLSELWFGGGWIRSLNFANRMPFYGNLVEGDVQIRLPRFQLRAAGGYLHYDDDDTTMDNRRDVYYYYLEGVQDITRKFYGAARFSQILADGGFPITGGGTMAEYFFSPDLTTDYWRLSLGLGYRFSPNLIIKAEYSFNHGRELNGENRSDEDIFSLEAAFRF